MLQTKRNSQIKFHKTTYLNELADSIVNKVQMLSWKITDQQKQTI